MLPDVNPEPLITCEDTCVNGNCIDNECICEEGYFGEDCNLNALQNLMGTSWQTKTILIKETIFDSYYYPEDTATTQADTIISIDTLFYTTKIEPFDTFCNNLNAFDYNVFCSSYTNEVIQSPEDTAWVLGFKTLIPGTGFGLTNQLLGFNELFEVDNYITSEVYQLNDWEEDMYQIIELSGGFNANFDSTSFYIQTKDRNSSSQFGAGYTQYNIKNSEMIIEMTRE